MTPDAFVAITGGDKNDPNPCGYCHSPVPRSVSFGMWAYSMSVSLYQDLIDRGWRRSGQYLYKPDIRETCCPAYTIRLDVSLYEEAGGVSKSGKKVIKKMQRFLAEGKGKSKPSSLQQPPLKMDSSDDPQKSASNSLQSKNVNTSESNSAETSQSFEDESMDTEGASNVNENMLTTVNLSNIPSAMEVDSSSITADSKLLDTNDKICSLAQKDTEETLITVTKEKNPTNTSKPAKQPWIKKPKQRAQSNTTTISYLIQNAEQPGLKEKGGHVLRVDIVPAVMDDEVYSIYRKYQMGVHKDPPEKLSESGFTRFLVDSPLKFVEPAHENVPGFGTFHQKYYIDDTLIAVAVIDILPKCVSSVYFMYDPTNPDIVYLSMGVYSALREIYLTKQLQAVYPELKYYYMGYYIHSCSKMRYKAQFKPSDLACPVTYEWVPVHLSTPLLDKDPIARLSSVLPDADHNRPVLGKDALPPRDGKTVNDATIGQLFSFSNGSLVLFKNHRAFNKGQNKIDAKVLFELLGGIDMMRRFVFVF